MNWPHWLSWRHRPYLFGPILVRELRAAARRKRTFILRTGYLAVMTLILCVFWVSQRSSGYYPPGFGDPSVDNIVQQHYESSRLGRHFALTSLITQLVMLGLICPVLTCASISGERSAKTLGILMTTDLSVREIVMGKLASRTWVIALLIGLSLPVLLTARIMGGVSVLEIVALLLVTLTFSLFAASLGLLLSIVNKRSLTAALGAYAIIGFLYAGIPFMLAVTRFTRLTPGWAEWVIPLHPIVTSVHILIEPIIAGVDTPPWLICSAGHFAATVLLTLLSMVLVRRLMRRELEGGALERKPPRATTPAGSADQTHPTHAAPGVRPPGRGARTARRKPLRGNPVLWQELRTIKARRKPLKSALICALLTLVGGWLVYKLLVDTRGSEREGIVVTVIFVLWAWMFLAAAAAGATALAGEKDRGTWLPMLTTIMTPGQILRGKLLGVCRRLLAPVLVLLGFHAIVIGAGALGGGMRLRYDPWTGMHARVLVHVAMTLIGPVLFFVVLGMFYSMLCKRSTTAGVIHLVTVIGINVLPLFLIALAEIGNLVTHEEIFLAGCPMAWPISAAIGAWQGSGGWGRAGNTYSVFSSGNVNFAEFTAAYAFFCGLLLLGSVLIWLRMTAAFDRMNDRVARNWWPEKRGAG